MVIAKPLIMREKHIIVQKLKEIIPLLKKQKSVIFTNWLEHGTKIIEELLEQKKITFSTFHGSLTKKKRKEIIMQNLIIMNLMY